MSHLSYSRNFKMK